MNKTQKDRQIAAFDKLAGDSLGRLDSGDIIEDLLVLMRELGLSHVVERLQLEIQQDANSDDPEYQDDVIQECIDYLQDFAPAYCCIEWEDNEIRVIPCVDDELPRYEWEIPEDCSDDYAYTVTDHGNVTLWERKADGYYEVWAMV